MSGQLKNVKIVEFKEDYIVNDKLRYSKGVHAMNVKTLEKLKKSKIAKISFKDAEPEYKKMVEKIKERNEKAESK